MYTRVTTYQIDPARLNDVNTVLQELKGKCNSLPGILVYNTAWREDGRGISTTIYDCRASADEAAAMLSGIWTQFRDILIEDPVTETYTKTENMLFS